VGIEAAMARDARDFSRYESFRVVAAAAKERK